MISLIAWLYHVFSLSQTRGTSSFFRLNLDVIVLYRKIGSRYVKLCQRLFQTRKSVSKAARYLVDKACLRVDREQSYFWSLVDQDGVMLAIPLVQAQGGMVIIRYSPYRILRNVNTSPVTLSSVAYALY